MMMSTVVDESGEQIEEQSFSPPVSGTAAISTPLFSHALLFYFSRYSGGMRMNPVAQSAGLGVFQMVSREHLVVILASMR